MSPSRRSSPTTRTHIEEGTYRFSLPSGSTVSDFAVWDGPVRIPAVILERKRAEQVYEQARAQAIDPGLSCRWANATTPMPLHRRPSSPRRSCPSRRTAPSGLSWSITSASTASDFKQIFALPLQTRRGNQHQSARHFKLQFELRSAHAIADFQAASKLYPLTINTATISQPCRRDVRRLQIIALDEDFQATWSLAPAGHADQLEVITHRDPEDAVAQTLVQVAAPTSSPPRLSRASLRRRSLIAEGKDRAGLHRATLPRTLLLLFDNSLSMQWEKLKRSYAALAALLQSAHARRPLQRPALQSGCNQLPACTHRGDGGCGKAGAGLCPIASKLRGGTDLGEGPQRRARAEHGAEHLDHPA